MTAVPVKMDRRDRILDRLFEILGGLTIELSTGTIIPDHFVHNRNELPAEKVPGIILLDADEVWDPNTPNLASRGDGQASPGLLRMTPEVYVVLDVRKPNNKVVGKDLNTARAKIIGSVINDTQLKAFVGTNGQIRYDGCVTDLARNRTMQGQMGLSITFVYPFIPGEFNDTP